MKFVSSVVASLAFLSCMNYPSPTLGFMPKPAGFQPSKCASYYDTSRPLTILSSSSSSSSSSTSTQSNLGTMNTSNKNDSVNNNKISNNPRKHGLALQLDDGTRKSHSVAQNSAFVTGFFKGLSTRESYSKLLTSLYFVYKAMEEAFDYTTEENVKQMDYPQLRRLSSLRQDMEYFHGANWEENIEPSPAAQAYVDRINELANSPPGDLFSKRLLIAHQYTRYLGDLFGGQMMAGMAKKSLGLNEPMMDATTTAAATTTTTTVTTKGTAFYTFDEIDDTFHFITDWYTKLNELDLSEKEKQSIVDEANLAFSFNIGLLEELEGSALQAAWAVAWETFREKMGLVKK